jgi:hypothetical protein
LNGFLEFDNGISTTVTNFPGFRPFVKGGTSYSLSLEHLDGTILREEGGRCEFFVANQSFTMPESGRSEYTKVLPADDLLDSGIRYNKKVTFNNYKFKVQIELGDKATEYENSIFEKFTPNADGTVDNVTSLYPMTTLLTDTKDVTIECVYNKDINKAIGDVSGNEHTHTIEDVEGLSDALGEKADENHTHTIEDVEGLSDALGEKADENHTHGVEDVEGLKEINEALGQKADKKDVANSIKETATGNAIILKDISPLEQTLSVKSSSGSQITVCRQNIWDEQWLRSGDFIISKNYIPVVSGETYYLHCSSPFFSEFEETGEVLLFDTIYFFDADRSYLNGARPISARRNSCITIPDGCRYIKFNLPLWYGETYNNDICINVSNTKINGKYAPYQGETGTEITINAPFDCPITVFAEDKDTVLECEYSKDINKVLKDDWELISSGEITQEVSMLELGGFSCSKVILKVAVKGSATNTSNGALSFWANSTSNDYAVKNTSLAQTFRGDGVTINVVALLEIRNKTITGHLFGASGVDSEYLNRQDNESIKLLYLRPVTNGMVFGVGTTYELWGC